MSHAVLLRRSGDKAWQWAVLFAIFAVITVPFYCVTRKSWKPLFHVFAGVSSFAVLWAIIVGLLDVLTGGNYQENSVAESVLYIGSLAAIYASGYYSVRHLQKSALGRIRSGERPSTTNTTASPISKAELSAAEDLLSPHHVESRRPQRVPALIVGIIVMLISGYAIHTTTVEATIKANPVLAAVARTGTIVRIKHFNCGEMYGYYDSSINTLQICTAVHDDQLFSSKELTIKHEAWHLVQACSAVKSKDDEWGRFDLVNSPLLAEKSLTADESTHIAENYDEQYHAIESEALLAETHLTSGQVIQAIEDSCYFRE